METTTAVDNQQPRTISARVVVRHSRDCARAKKCEHKNNHGKPDCKGGSGCRHCDCPKSILAYDGSGSGKNRFISAKTRSWSRAEEFRQRWLDDQDPVKRENRLLKAEKERQLVRIEDAVASYVQDMAARLGDNGTCAMARSLLGHVDPETKAIVKNGHLFDWLDSRPVKIQFVSEITSPLLTAWRASWKFGSDLTASQRWGMVRSFFAFCERQGYIEDDPARDIRRPKVVKGNRTAIFTDEQFAAIVDAVPLTRASWRTQLEAFVMLLRWSGMAIADAVQFRVDMIDAEGVLRYRRMKTKELAVVPLPDHAVAMLRNVPAERDTTDSSQPFRTGVALRPDTRRWTRRLEELFKNAGITEVRTESGRVRKPHPHTLRDTMAVWYLRHGAGVHTVAKMLGHSNITTTQRAYLPYVQELQDSMIADARKSLAHAGPAVKKTKRGKL